VPDRNQTEELTTAERDWLRAVVRRDGAKRVADWVGISRDALVSALAGTGSRGSTLHLIRARTRPCP
jgi:FixJ family two-component response regulator